MLGIDLLNEVVVKLFSNCLLEFDVDVIYHPFLSHYYAVIVYNSNTDIQYLYIIPIFSFIITISCSMLSNLSFIYDFKS